MIKQLTIRGKAAAAAGDAPEHLSWLPAVTTTTVQISANIFQCGNSFAKIFIS